MVSAKFSPFLIAATLGSAKPIVVPPSLFMAASKLRRVRVLGSKKRVAKILPRSMSEPLLAMGSIVLAIFRI